jgi:PTS system mannitol-specific IIC component
MTNQRLTPVLDRSAIVLGQPSVAKNEAISAAGRLLVKRGLVMDDYVEAMIKREATVSTYMGNGVALPHGTFESRHTVLGTGIVVLQYPKGVAWPNGMAHLVIGLAASSDAHVAVLSQLASILQDKDLCELLWTTEDREFVYATLSKEPED